MKKLPLVINLRGNSGSGKTYTTRAFMGCCKRPESRGDDTLMYFEGHPFVVLGRYSNACGGCDTIRTYEEVLRRVTLYTGRGYNVWMEGLLMSTTYGAIGEYARRFGDRWIAAFLFPPLDVCLRRIQSRRDEAGNTKPFNPANTIARERAIKSCSLRWRENGHRVIVLNWEDPVLALLRIIRKEAL